MQRCYDIYLYSVPCENNLQKRKVRTVYKKKKKKKKGKERKREKKERRKKNKPDFDKMRDFATRTFWGGTGGLSPPVFLYFLRAERAFAS